MLTPGWIFCQAASARVRSKLPTIIFSEAIMLIDGIYQQRTPREAAIWVRILNKISGSPNWHARKWAAAIRSSCSAIWRRLRGEAFVSSLADCWIMKLWKKICDPSIVWSFHDWTICQVAYPVIELKNRPSKTSRWICFIVWYLPVKGFDETQLDKEETLGYYIVMRYNDKRYTGERYRGFEAHDSR